MTETALLLINSCAVLESLLIKSEWQVEQASSLAVAEQKLQEKTYPLVLVAIKPDQHDALYSLIGQHSSSLWIGLIERDCLASEALHARAWLIELWHLLRPALLGRTAVPPRIWST